MMIYDNDSYLMPFKKAIDARHARIADAVGKIAGNSEGSLYDNINNHLYYGLHRQADGSWVFRECAPNAVRIYLIGDFNNWKRTGGYCPCRLERTEENKCMCKEFRDQIADPNFKGYCHCMLYYKD